MQNMCMNNVYQSCRNSERVTFDPIFFNVKVDEKTDEIIACLLF